MTPKSLQARRLALGLSQQQVAYLAACSISRVGQIEREIAGDASDVRARIDDVLAAEERKRDQARVAEASA